MEQCTRLGVPLATARRIPAKCFNQEPTRKYTFSPNTRRRWTHLINHYHELFEIMNKLLHIFRQVNETCQKEYGNSDGSDDEVEYSDGEGEVDVAHGRIRWHINPS